VNGHVSQRTEQSFVIPAVAHSLGSYWRQAELSLCPWQRPSRRMVGEIVGENVGNVVDGDADGETVGDVVGEAVVGQTPQTTGQAVSARDPSVVQMSNCS